MTENAYHVLAAHKCDHHAATTPLDWRMSAQRRELLVQEIRSLQQHLDILTEHEHRANFSARQTCREMIHSRQQLYRQLRR